LKADSKSLPKPIERRFQVISLFVNKPENNLLGKSKKKPFLGFFIHHSWNYLGFKAKNQLNWLLESSKPKSKPNNFTIGEQIWDILSSPSGIFEQTVKKIHEW
jgi:hypothetical protein